jgi:hypothetical protein
MTKILDERDFAHVGDKAASLRVEDIAASRARATTCTGT